MSVIVSTFLIFIFVDQLLLVDVFSAVPFNSRNNNAGVTVTNR